jgi:hypothetical protein
MPQLKPKTRSGVKKVQIQTSTGKKVDTIEELQDSEAEDEQVLDQEIAKVNENENKNTRAEQEATRALGKEAKQRAYAKKQDRAHAESEGKRGGHGRANKRKHDDDDSSNNSDSYDSDPVPNRKSGRDPHHEGGDPSADEVDKDGLTAFQASLMCLAGINQATAIQVSTDIFDSVDTIMQMTTATLKSAIKTVNTQSSQRT